MIRLLAVVLVVVPATIVYGARILWAAWRGVPRGTPLYEEIPRKWSALILRAAGVRVVLEGADVIDPDRPQILVANHASWFDVPAVAAHLPGIYRFVAKQELTSVPIFGRAFQACGHIAIDRKNRERAMASLAIARQRLEEERPTVIMFPEGTRSPDGNLLPFKKGAFLLAIQTGVEVVPMAIVGSRDVMPKGSWLIRSGTITLRFGRPIAVEGLDIEDRDVLVARARDAVQRLLDGHHNPPNEPD